MPLVAAEHLVSDDVVVFEDPITGRRWTRTVQISVARSGATNGPDHEFWFLWVDRIVPDRMGMEGVFNADVSGRPTHCLEIRRGTLLQCRTLSPYRRRSHA